MIGTMLYLFYDVLNWMKKRRQSGNLNEISTLDLTLDCLVEENEVPPVVSESMIVFSDWRKTSNSKYVLCNDKNNNYTLSVVGKMSLAGGVAPGVTPESDCNSNNVANDVSICSNASMDFVQDNSDYQWVLEYGYREQGAMHRSVLSLTSSHEVGYYDELARNLDANLAEVEMEDFQSKDIHSILSTLQNDVQGLEEREMFASVSGSLMVKFDFESSISPHSSSQDVMASLSACKSEPLFSPLRQTCLPNANLSIDSLDLSDDMNILVTCQANKNNYTIAFEGSTVMGSESDLLDNGDLTRGDGNVNEQGDTMVRSDSMYTTWSQLKQQSRGSDNGNTEPCETVKSISMPDLCNQPKSQAMPMSVSSKLSSETGSDQSGSGSDPRTVKLYDIRKSAMTESSTSGGDKSRPRNFSLVKLFMKQKGGSSDGMEQSSASECWGERSEQAECVSSHKMKMKASESADAVLERANYNAARNVNNNNSFVAGMDKACQTEGKSPVFVVYPNYTLPSLDFIKDNHQVGNVDWSRVLFRGQKFAPTGKQRPFSLNDMEGLKKKGFHHIQDWASLTFLLPKECKEFLDGIPEMATNLKEVKKPLYNITSASSGYRGSSTMINSSSTDDAQPKGILRDTQNRYVCKTAKDSANLRRIEELMELSAVFGDSSESVTESEVVKLRSQVSRFMTMQKELERVSERLSTKDVCLDSSECRRKTVSFVGRGATPPNSPTVSQGHRQHLAGARRLVEIPICEETDSSETPHMNLTSCLVSKKDLVQDVERSVEKVLRLASKPGHDNDELAQACLQYLCPSLYAVLSDGLRDNLCTPFGPIPNSVWAVVEASSQQGPMTRALHELVQRLNREIVLTEPLLKVNAFFFGLLNVEALDGWLSYLRTQDGILHKHYESRGLFVLANSIGSVRAVVDKLIDVLRPLSKLVFSLDLLHQAKILHRSLSSINSLLEATNSESLLSPSKQLMLLKLVQSIQNSGKEDPEASKPKEGRAERRQTSRTSKQRPRSGCEIVAGRDSSAANCANKKRWSGVQLNSKLSRAFEQLGEDSEYTDSLDGPARNNSSASKRLQFSDDTSQDISTAWGQDSCAGKCSPVSHDHKKNVLSSLNRKGAPEPTGGQKFKRLQQRWEQLSGRTDSGISPLASPEHKAVERLENTPLAGTPSPTTRQSRIPRLVTSPVRPGVGGASPFSVCQKPTGIPRKSATTAGMVSRGVGTSSRPGSAMVRPGPSAPRPTSLPYRTTSTLPSRRQPFVPPKASSMSLNRRPGSYTQGPLKIVRTVTHRLPSDSGHLAFNEGERLRVVLEVDDTYLLCCSGNQKGLVPKSTVIPVP